MHDDTSPLPRPDETQPFGAHQTPQSGASYPPPPPAAVGTLPPQQPRRRGGLRRVGELSAVAVLAAALASGGTVAATTLADGDQGTTTSASSQLPQSSVVPVTDAQKSAPDWQSVASAVGPSVVSITVKSAQGEGQGSGVVMDDQGHVLTNNHVATGAGEGSGSQITVTLSDGNTYAATIAGTDPSTDLAVLTITDPPKELTPITFGASDSLAVGDPVMAIGNPLGLSGTVTTGVVSALDRPVSTSDSSSQDPFAQGQSQGETVVTNAVQTSAAINPGNSGGALVDASGRLVGINSSIASTGSSSGGQSGSIGIGFAIPVDQARMIADQLITDGSAQHAFLGVTPSDGTAKSGSATRSGAKIEQVSQGSGAAKAGLEVGDLVIAVGDAPVTSAESLVAHVREEAVGSTVKLTVIRDGKSTQVDVTLGERTEG